MDSRRSAQEVQQCIEIIKARMPETYKCIGAKAAKVGNVAYELVRRGLRGEPSCFWAMEGGYVMGTPFALEEVSRDIAQYMVTFGCAHVCVFATLPQEVSHGTH